jgi:hypothetical protein
LKKMQKSSQQSSCGFSLVEVLIGSIILAAIGVPIINMFLGSKDNIARTDRRRDARFFMSEILAHVERHSLHDLWDWYGPNEVVAEAGRMKHQLAKLDKKGFVSDSQNGNPLGFTQEFLYDMTRNEFEARLYFEFYSRKELEIEPAVYNPRVKDRAEKYGILHMQAGYIKVELYDLRLLAKNPKDEPAAMIDGWAQPIMCPAVVGRPGLKLSSCPAVNEATRRKYEPLLRRREAAF